MNRTTANTTLLSCGFPFFPLNPAKISPDLHAVFIVRLAVNSLTCPLIILLNMLVIVAVKTKRQLRTKSKVALACLATTDLVVGLVAQPLHIASEILLLKSQESDFCTVFKLTTSVTGKCLAASFNHLLLMSVERYLAMNHPFTHNDRVTAVRIIMASGLAWALVIIVPLQDIVMGNNPIVTLLLSSVLPFLVFPAMVYFNVVIYREVRRNERQIAANQVSLEAKEKMLKNKEAFCTTTIVLLVIFLCYVPIRVCTVLLTNFKDAIPVNVGHIVVYLVTLLPVLNSLFNPLIYAVRIRAFRVAFIQLLARKTITQAKELERKIFGPRQIGVVANVEQGQNNAGQVA